MAKQLRKNLSNKERIIRILIGIILCVLSAINIIGTWGYLGILLAISGLLRYCLIYQWLGISTCTRNCEIDSDDEQARNRPKI